MRRLVEGAALALLAVGCAAPPQPKPSGAPASVEEHIAAINAAARRSEREADLHVRVQLAEEARAEAEACLALEPRAAACLYGDALALGLAARAHPAHAGESLTKMLTELTAAEAADPAYDEAGPARVRALVLTRAPGWPLGPGDPAAAVIAAQRAVSLRPHYAPNQLALGEALSKSGDPQAGRGAFERAHDEALAAPSGADRDEWLREAERALH